MTNKILQIREKEKNKRETVYPCYNEQDALPVFYPQIIKVLSSLNIDYELIFINDGSKDKTLSIIKDFARENANVKYLSFLRNFGKEAAMYAGSYNTPS